MFQVDTLIFVTLLTPIQLNLITLKKKTTTTYSNTRAEWKNQGTQRDTQLELSLVLFQVLRLFNNCKPVNLIW